MKKMATKMVDDLDDAQVILVNTCTFIDAAKEESIQTILQAAEYKKSGICEKLVVAGCLAQQYKKSLSAELPEVDIFIGTESWQLISEALKESYAEPRGKCFQVQHETLQ